MRRKKEDIKRHQILFINSKGFFLREVLLEKISWNDILFMENFHFFIAVLSKIKFNTSCI